MKKNSALAGFCSRFQDILNELDEFEADDVMEELNAEFEDTLFMAESIDPEDEDAAEEIADFIEDMKDLLGEYRSAAAQCPEITPKLDELEMAIRMAAANLL